MGLLHTVPALAPLFHDLLRARRGDLDIVHVVDPALLADTIAAGGVTDEVAARVRGHVESLARAGASKVLVTCSSIGEAAERASADTGVSVVRVDAAMAGTAVDRASSAGTETGRVGTIAVLATLEATLGPTVRLVERALTSADVRVTATLVPQAAEARADGDGATHDRLIAAAVGATDADVVVLAQASMAAAAGGDTRVLTSPESGATAFVDELGAVV
ncbi:aspartate/glutamate racemase family protein [Microbacterium sp. P01]|uniref:aspartate/glutamate racemase family protein n=1 Tax=Microbacterium sp. P01 TaxID=3366261 RepID=UPI003672A649